MSEKTIVAKRFEMTLGPSRGGMFCVTVTEIGTGKKVDEFIGASRYLVYEALVHAGYELVTFVELPKDHFYHLLDVRVK